MTRSPLACSVALACVVASALPARAQDAPRFHVRASVGAGQTSDTRLLDRACDPAPLLNFFGCEPGTDGEQIGARGDFDRGAAVEFAAGMRVLRFLRVEAAVSHLSGAGSSGNATFLGAGKSQPVSAFVSATTLMARAILDLGLVSTGRVEPFVCSVAVGVVLGGGGDRGRDVRLLAGADARRDSRQGCPARVVECHPPGWRDTLVDESRGRVCRHGAVGRRAGLPGFLAEAPDAGGFSRGAAGSIRVGAVARVLRVVRCDAREPVGGGHGRGSAVWTRALSPGGSRRRGAGPRDDQSPARALRHDDGPPVGMVVRGQSKRPGFSVRGAPVWPPPRPAFDAVSPRRPRTPPSWDRSR
jgi:hypothetical protein